MDKQPKKNLDLAGFGLALIIGIYTAGYCLKDVVQKYDNIYWCNSYVSRMKSDNVIADDISGLCGNECFSSTLVELADGRMDLIDAYRLARKRCRVCA